MGTIFWIILAIAYLGSVIYAVNILRKTHILTPAQKRINIVLTFILPFLWPVLMHYILKKEPSSYEYPKKTTSRPFDDNGIDMETGHHF